MRTEDHPMFPMFMRAGFTALVVTSLLVAGGVPAWAMAIDDPDLFGPSEPWERPSAIEPGDSGPWVRRLQHGLAGAGFRPGTPDGVFGKATLGAVYAFQKVHGLPRDGVFHTDHWDLLDTQISLPETTVDPDRVEIDLEDQVLYLIKDDAIEVVLPVSSGNGETYIGRGGSPVRARTPEGAYTFNRRHRGWRISYLGGLYNPYYFYGGYAVHGSTSVPPHPASHGCVRVELHDMDYLVTELSLGMPIYIYGNDVERSELLPSPPAKPSLSVPMVAPPPAVARWPSSPFEV